MRHVRAERWAQGTSRIHRMHPAAKILSAVALLIGVSTSHASVIASCLAYLTLLLALTVAAGLNPQALLRAAARVLPLAAFFAVISFALGEQDRAWALLARSYTSAYCGLLLIATTSMPSLIRGLDVLRVPEFLLLVMQFLYRYVIVLFAEAAAIRDAALTRGGSIRNMQFRQAGAAAGVLFARSYQRATSIHQAMTARGFAGHIPTFAPEAFRRFDIAALSAVCAGSLTIRLVLR